MRKQLADILRQAGQLLLELRASGAVMHQRRGAVVKASADVEVHRFLAQALTTLSPGVPVVSEEDAHTHGHERPDLYWLIDPIDGTASFVDGFPGFVTQAALMHDRRPVLAGVHAPVLAETFLAEAGAGASRNGARLNVATRARGEWVLIDNTPAPHGLAARLTRDWSIPGYLECGSIGLKICRVAEGRADLFVKDIPVRDWDVAAPQLVLEEAGGCLRDPEGRPFAYTGPFEHAGLIACTSVDTVARVVAWSKRQTAQ